MHIKIEYEEDGVAKEFKDVNTCLEFILRLEKTTDKPLGIFIHNGNGESISSIIAAQTTSFVYYPTGYNGVGSYTSKGSENDGAVLSFWLCGHHTEAARESQVSRSCLEPVIKEFLKFGGKSHSIDWIKD